MNEVLREKHRDAAPVDSSPWRFVCPARGVAITDRICGDTRREAQREIRPVCTNCLIPLAPAYCMKCGRAFSSQEARAGFTCCEFCGEGGAA